MATIRHRRRLGRDLARIRERLGLSQDQVADGLGWSRPTVGRIEGARTQARPEQVEALLTLYKVGDDEHERLLQLATGSAGSGWWTSYNDVFTGNYVALEDEAALIRSWQNQVVPGLLQIEAYARAVIAAARREPAEFVHRRVQARMARRTLLGRPSPPRLTAVLDEAVLLREVGGSDVMGAQLRHLLEVSRQDNIEIRILPFSAGAHPGLEGRFVILSFDDDDPDVPFIESQGGAVYLEADDEIDRVNVSWDDVLDLALSVEDSRAKLARLAKGVTP